MTLAVFSHKLCWHSEHSPTGWATDGGFVFHIQSLASAYNQTILLVPVSKMGKSKGEVWFTDNTIKVVPLLEPFGSGIVRKLLFPVWFLLQLPKFIYYTNKADVVHTPIPGDIGTIGMLLAPLFGKKIFIRYCGNWKALKTLPEKFWAWYGEKFAGKSIAYFCTGGDAAPPSKKNAALQWIFSSSMIASEIESFKQKAFDFNREYKLVMGGRLTKEKGFGILIDAVALIANKIPHVKVYIFGDGPDRELFEAQVIKYSLQDKVQYLGKLNASQVHQALNDADVFCFPTYSSEGFPKAVIEAMAHGIPVISTEVSVIPVLINEPNRPAGVLIDKKSPEQLAEKIAFYYNNPQVHKTHADNAKLIAAVYTLEKWVDTINEKLNAQWNTKICRIRNIVK